MRFVLTADEIISELWRLVYRLNKEKRIPHIKGIAKFSAQLCRHHGKDANSLQIAAIAHDLFRDISPHQLFTLSKVYGIDCTYYEEQHPVLLHGKICAHWLKKRFGRCIRDFDSIFEAVYYHSSGTVFSSYVGEYLFIADSLEHSRQFPQVEELRRIAFQDTKMAFCSVVTQKISYAIEKKLYLLPETCHAWNQRCISMSEESLDDPLL